MTPNKKLAKLSRSALVARIIELETLLPRRDSEITKLKDAATYHTAMNTRLVEELRGRIKSLETQVSDNVAMANTAINGRRVVDQELKLARAEAKRMARALHIVTESTYEG